MLLIFHLSPHARCANLGLGLIPRFTRRMFHSFPFCCLQAVFLHFHIAIFPCPPRKDILYSFSTGHPEQMYFIYSRLDCPAFFYVPFIFHSFGAKSNHFCARTPLLPGLKLPLSPFVYNICKGNQMFPLLLRRWGLRIPRTETAGVV